MPQITCPNCGKTINMKNRSAVHQKPCTFTDLLHITKLPRKTLSIRIKQLRAMGVLIQKDRFYCANGTCGIKNLRFPRFSRIFDNKTIKNCSMFLLFVLAFSVASGYVLAMITTSPKKLESLTPTILGNFTVSLNVNEVDDLWAWQVAIEFNSSELTVLNVYSGDFFKVEEEFPKILWDAYSNRLLIGNTIYPGGTPKSGNGTLAIIVFGYFVENFRLPKVVNHSFDGFETCMIDSKGSFINVDEDTFTLIPEE